MKVKVTVNHVFYILSHTHKISATSASFLNGLRKQYGASNVIIERIQ